MSGTPSTSSHMRPVLIAPAVTSSGKPAPGDPGNAGVATMAFTCMTCARRKVRCDKLAPTCSTCRKARLDCEYQEPAPRKRKREPNDVHELLAQYESILKQHGLSPNDEAVANSAAEFEPSAPFYTSKRPPADQTSPGKLLTGEGKTRYIDSNIWRHLGEEDFHPSSDDEGGDERQSPWQSSSGPQDPISAALLGPKSPSSGLIDLHPTYESAMKLWKIYVENIDPLIKVVHVPTGRKMLQRAAANPSTASKATEALLFAIYHFALTSINDAECQKLFAAPQSALIAGYHDALRQALVNAYFLRTTDITVVQAYILFLLSVRNRYDPHTFWILTGVAVRLAQRLGLHRDGEDHGLKPFDIQMRRRIFYQLLPLDGHAAQLCGTGISIAANSWDTKQPLNINDDDIWPDMTETPEPRTGATDIIFCLARTELAKFVREANPAWGNFERLLEHKTIAEKDARLSSLEEEMETKYLRYCDFADPLHNLVMAMGRGAMNSGRLRIRLPRAKAIKNLPENERREIWTIANKIIDYINAAHSNPALKRFEWHLQAFFQWDPLIWVLHEIRRDPHIHRDDGTWSKIERIYADHPSILTQKRALHTAVIQLTLRSWEASQSTLSPEERQAQPEPLFIANIRHLLNRRGSTQDSNSTPADEYNPFKPSAYQFEDLLVSNFSNVDWDPDNIDFNSMANFNGDAMDWLFWDQLVHGPNAFPSA